MSEIQPIRSILLATDFSDRSAAAESYAVAMAAGFSAVLHVVSAIEPIMGLEPGDEDAAEFEEFYRRLASRADREIEARLASWTEINLIVKHHVEIGPRWKVIVEHAIREKVDLVVLGRGPSKDRRTGHLGTTSQKVFFTCPSPVMFVPQDANAV